jgi:signal transduction histidine kinase
MIRGSGSLGICPKDLKDPAKLANRILACLRREFKIERAALYILNPTRGDLEIEVAVGVAVAVRKKRLRLGEGVVGWVASRGTAARADLEKIPGGLGRGGSEMAAPMSEGDNLLGVLVVGTRKKKYFQIGQESILAAFAQEAAGWLSLAWRVAGTREESQRAAALAQVGAAIGAEETAAAILRRVTQESARLCGANLASLFLLEPDSQELRLELSRGGSRRYQMQPALSTSDTVLGYVVRRRRPFSVSAVAESPQDPHMELIRQEGIISFLAVPLAEKNQAVGVLCVGTKASRRFSDAEIRLIEGLAGLAAAALKRAKLAARLDQTEEELRGRERLSSLGMLAAEVAHEVRNPLAVIRMLWHTAIRGLQPSPEQVKDLSLIEIKLGQMNSILDRILNFARSADPLIGAVNAAEIMSEVALLTRSKLSLGGIRLLLKLPSAGPVEIRGDRSQLEQAVLNLVLNALESMSPGGTLTLQVLARQEEVSLFVHDTGRGMGKEVTARLFEPFLSRRPGGTGLGMALVRRTVEAHGGSVRVESKLGQATKVELRLPVWVNPKT